MSTHTLTELKLILDPVDLKMEASLGEKKGYSSEGPKAYHDISKVIFILTGNHDITDKAINRRAFTVMFPKVSLSNRENIAAIVWKDYARDLPLTGDHKRIVDEIITKTHLKFDGVGEMEAIIRIYIVECHQHSEQHFNVEREIHSYNATLTPSSPPPETTPNPEN